jgi:hypothetical protein
MTESHGTAHGHSRRGVLGAAAALGIVAGGGAAALAGTVGSVGPERSQSPGELAARDSDEPMASAAGTVQGPAQVWGAARSGQGTGVRGNGRLGVLGEGTHTGVAGDGFIGVRGTTSGIDGDELGVGVWAQAETPGSVALRADGASEFNGQADFSGITTFARSGVVTVRSGSSSVTRTGVALAADTVILATLQSRVDNVFVHAVETDPAAGSFIIHLTAAPDQDMPIGWLALN